MTFTDHLADVAEHPAMRDPLVAAMAQPDQAVLAIITDVIGAAYRKPGTMMALFADGSFAGALTNGCIEGDLAVHAADCLRTGKFTHLRYGAGSPFFDIRLPCGGALEIALYPRPELNVLTTVAARRSAREMVALRFHPDGQIRLQASQPTGWDGTDYVVDLPPAVAFAIFGEGPEAAVFTRLLQSAGFRHHLTTPSRQTFEMVSDFGCNAVLDNRMAIADLTTIDSRTAVVTFFHDHGRELPILRAALQSPAFYIGAQGSQRVAARRQTQLAELGVPHSELARLHGPIGLIPSARDARTLAISVLAEITALAESPV
jgi:xanthine dehydrogenase accessory factor